MFWFKHHFLNVCKYALTEELMLNNFFNLKTITRWLTLKFLIAN